MSTNTPPPFCNKCNAVLFDDSKIGGVIAQGDDGDEFLKKGEEDEKQVFPVDFEHNDAFPSLPLLSRSAEAGCKFCDLLKTAIMRLYPDLPKFVHFEQEDGISKIIEIEIRMQYIWQENMRKVPKARGLQRLEIILCGKNNQRQKSMEIPIVCFVESAPGPCASWLRLNINEPGYVLGPDTISWIQNNLDSTADLSLSNPQSDSEFVPTRLVRVDCQSPRLVETYYGFGQGNLRHPFRYAAISYCWGSPEQAKLQLKTERSSLLSRLSSIEEHKMTRVLRDAVETCRALSIPYLWINTLCIIQDDPQDWEQESTSMGKIYTNAYLTICALSSDSCNESFLTRKPSQIEIPFFSKVKPEIHGSYNLRVKLPPIYADSTGEDHSSSKWEKRAWTFQEEATSVRIMAFGSSYVHFITPWKRQTQGEQAVDDLYSFRTNELLRHRGHIDDYYSLWYSSVVPDILLNDEYAAGLWKRDLHRGLFWYRSVDEIQSWDVFLHQLSDTSEYVAPSWKCGSPTTLYMFQGNFSQREYRNMEVDITLNGVDPFGQVKGASLRITAKICPLPADMIIIGKGEGEQIVSSPGIPMEPRREVMMLWFGTAINPRSDEVDIDLSEDARWAYGLLVHPIPRTDEYFRVGIFCSGPSHKWRTRLFNDCPEKTIVLI
ncbi:HET-domain-containing protein [Annulohypoxylon bovei var. microspora]|nr:HET-domain-containing protein [Annulohypoxylon bovei var. microspora]